MGDVETQSFLLRRYQGQYAHLKLVLGLFVAIAAMGLLAPLAGQVLPEPWPSILLGIAGLAYALFVLTMPGRYRRRRREGLLLVLDEQHARLVDTRTRRERVRVARDNLQVSRAEHHYNVTMRGGAGGTFRAPVLQLRFPGQRDLTVAAEASALHWGDEVPRIRRPDASIGRDDWPRLVAALGHYGALVEVADARVR